MNIIADESKLKNDASAILLINKIKNLDIDQDALIYYNFPFYRGETEDDLIQSHVLYVSRKFGIIAFKAIASVAFINKEVLMQIERLDGHLFSKINKIDELRKGRRDLKINITPILVSDQFQKRDNINIITINEVREAIENNILQELNENEFNALIATIEGTKKTKLRKDRDTSDETLTKGKILSLIQQEETVFDLEQKRAALNTLDSPQRIRGLAGSGKTIILTMKAALYHIQNPEALILYTYFTKSLYGQIKYLIEKFYRDFSENEEPDWSKIQILHGWGGRSLNGVYSEACFDNDVSPITFPEAKRANPQDPFGYVCMMLIENHYLNQKYDLTLIDEGQDFPLHFYQLCYILTRERRIVWAYDDFQNIFDTKIQDEKETFGKDKDGNYLVDFSRNENMLQDIVLHKCYRNPKKALTAAFSLGLGIYNSRVLQRLENNQHWTDLGFMVESGDSSDGSDMVISRPDENSPMDTNNYFGNDTIQYKKFNDFNVECSTVANDIILKIRKEKLKPDDICVISLDEKFINGYFERIEKILSRNGVNAFNLLNAPNNNTYFSIENHVTLSSINKAKGNEVGMVYVVGVDAAFTKNNIDYIVYRNKLFTAITRTKGWVIITGTGDDFSLFEKEFSNLSKNEFKFIFKQPSRESTNTIFRRMDERQTILNRINKNIADLLKTGLPADDILNMIDPLKSK